LLSIILRLRLFGGCAKNPYLGSDSILVTTRVGTTTAKEFEWGLSTDGKAIFYPKDEAALVRQLMANDKLIIRLTPARKSPTTSTFELMGLADAIQPMMHVIQ
jgi:type VI secretion system protein VasI